MFSVKYQEYLPSIQILMISMSHFCVNIYPPISLSAKIVHLAPLRPRPGGNQGDDRHKLISEISWTPICKMFPNIHTHRVHKLSPAPAPARLWLVPPPPVPDTRQAPPQAESGLGLADPWSSQWIAGRLDVSSQHNIVSHIQDGLKRSGDTRATDFASKPESAILCLMFKYLC